MQTFSIIWPQPDGAAGIKVSIIWPQPDGAAGMKL